MRNHRKYRVANKARFTAFVAVTLVLMAFIVSTALGYNTASGASTKEFVQVKVESGDTLWALAQEYGPADMDVRSVVFQICRLNGLSAGDLQPGQYITIPTEL